MVLTITTTDWETGTIVSPVDTVSETSGGKRLQQQSHRSTSASGEISAR